MNEEELIKLVKQGDEAAFKILVETWQDLVYNTSVGILQNTEDAEDVAQDVFIKVYGSIGNFKGESKFSTWLYRITLSKAADHIRRKGRKKRFAFVQSLYGKNDEQVIDPPDFFHPGVELENKENSVVLFKAMEQLPPNQKNAFVLNKIENLSYREIADILNSSEAAVDALLQRAKNNLRKYLEKYYSSYDS